LRAIPIFFNRLRIISVNNVVRRLILNLILSNIDILGMTHVVHVSPSAWLEYSGKLLTERWIVGMDDRLLVLRKGGISAEGLILRLILPIIGLVLRVSVVNCLRMFFAEYLTVARLTTRGQSFSIVVVHGCFEAIGNIN
jgi:hypothetical protein